MGKPLWDVEINLDTRKYTSILSYLKVNDPQGLQIIKIMFLLRVKLKVVLIVESFDV